MRLKRDFMITLAGHYMIPEIGLSAKSTIDSLRYGRTIQDAILCTRIQLKKIFGDFAIVYEPKNILSGDFYYCKEKNGKKYLAVCDCTGHGIAGSLLTILGHNMLERSLRRYDDTGEILTFLNNCIIESFDASSSVCGVGMDAVFISIDKETLLMSFAGAKRPIGVLRGDQLICLKTDKHSIGYTTDHEWHSQTFQLEKSDKLFLFSDGYLDQFGEDCGTKFGIRKFKELLISLAHKSISEINEILNNTLLNHRKNEVPTDDVLVLGIEI
jgi:serine phosphatase RsbU (regulator of sigma subunit)